MPQGWVIVVMHRYYFPFFRFFSSPSGEAWYRGVRGSGAGVAGGGG